MIENCISEPIRIANVIGGHVHPAACVTGGGMILVVYNKEGGGGKELLLSRSSDGGTTWSHSVSIPTIRDCSIYPGSLTTLKDGRILLNWSCYHQAAEKLWREPQFSISTDEGETWSEPQNYPIVDHTNYTCMRHPVVEWATDQWVCPFYDRTVLYKMQTHEMAAFGDQRNHGMVPIVQTSKGTLISGAPQTNAPVPVGVPGNMVRGLRSTDGGKTWQALGVFPHFGVAGYDLTVLTNDWIVLTYIVYGIGHDGEYSYEVVVSRDDGKTWDFDGAVEVHNPRRRIMGRGWPRTVQIDAETLGTVFYDLEQNQPGGPGVFIVRTSLARIS
ncbi:exo-alpha-sialidase [Candidatus Poribacteria bacterium]|nr:exo-alpha-sialidase [Candidatus Poribacteria bacterium]